MFSINSYATSYKLYDRGFIALISVIIIGFVLLLSVIALGGKGIAGRFNLLNLEYKNSSYQLASGCVQTAIIYIVNDPSYNPPAPIPIAFGPIIEIVWGRISKFILFKISFP